MIETLVTDTIMHQQAAAKARKKTQEKNPGLVRHCAGRLEDITIIIKVKRQRCRLGGKRQHCRLGGKRQEVSRKVLVFCRHYIMRQSHSIG